MPQSLPPDETRGPLVLGLVWATYGLAFIAVIARLYARRVSKSTGWDDYLIVAALINITFLDIANTFQVHYGFGRHIEYVTSTLPQILKWTTISEITCTSAVCLLKLSVCTFVLRVIRKTHRRLQCTLYCLMVFLVVAGLTAMLLIGLECIPLYKLWDTSVPGRCFSPKILSTITQVFGAIGAVTDLLCVIIPLYVIRGLQINRSSKIALFAVLVLGLIPAIASIAKSVVVAFTAEDITWDQVPVEIWITIEANFGIFVACLPALGHFFTKAMIRLSQLSSDRSHTSIGQEHTSVEKSSRKNSQDSRSRLQSNADSFRFDTEDYDIKRPERAVTVLRTTDVEAQSFRSDDLSLIGTHPQYVCTIDGRE